MSRDTVILLPEDIVAAIEKYVATDWAKQDPSKIGALNAVAYIGERLIALVQNLPHELAKNHPLLDLELAAHEYDVAHRKTVYADRAAKDAPWGHENERSLKAAKTRGRKIARSAKLQDAAIRFAEWHKRIEGDS